MTTTERTLALCRPCLDGTHPECEGSASKPCDCIVCEGERIGDRMVGEPGQIKHPIPDRMAPRQWRP